MKTNFPMTKSFTAVCIAASSLLSTAAVRATVVDLNSGSGATGSGTVNGALFSINTLQPAGSGVIDPFLTIQQHGPGGPEQGYNSTALPFDTKRTTYNHEIKLGDLGQVTIGNTAYFQFVVDVNEPNGKGKSLISLDMLKVYTSPSIQTNTSTTPTVQGGVAFDLFNGSLGNLRYDLSNPVGLNSVLYNDVHHGSGQADINIYIPVSDFAGASPNDYLYMYQAWGFNASADFETSGGFEETFFLKGNSFTPVPEVPAFLPLAAVLLVAVGGHMLWARRKESSELTA